MKRPAFAAAALAVLLAFGPAAQALAATPAAIAAKEEVVYAKLEMNGSPREVTVVNRFEVTGGGTLRDAGDYVSVENLSTTSPLSYADGEVSAEVEEGEFYYQGRLANTALPWNLSIRYLLNGEELPAAQLAGQSGALEIRLTTSENPAADPSFYENYMLQITLTLPGDKSSEVESEGATIAASGKDRAVTHTVLPGKNADISVKAQVEAFEMAGIQIAALPFSSPVEMPDTGELTGEMTSLTDAVGSVNDGVGKLATGVNELNSGVQGLVDGSAQFQSGLDQLNGNAGALVSGSAEIKKALEKVAKQLAGSDGGDTGLGELAELPAGLRQMSAGLGEVQGGLGTLKEGYAGMQAALDAAIMAIPDGALGEAEIGALYAALADPAQQAALGQLVAGYTAALTVKGTYTTPDPASGVSIQAGMAAVTGSLETMQGALGTVVAGLDEMAGGLEASLGKSDISKQMAELGKGMKKLANEYGSFHEGLVAYTGGVGQVAQGYGSLHGGLAQLGQGVGELAGGAGQLHRGTGELHEAVAELPETMEVEIDALMADYDTSDFTPVSFTAAANTKLRQVQFVLMTDAITLPEAPAAEDEAAGESSIWDRFLDLFR